jgi:arylsulfatase A-like enzyme/Flp pilus assembly protein TadD
MRTELKKRILFLFFILAGIIFTDYSILGSEAKRADLNLLLITIDTIRPDRLSCYSTKYLQTPRIDAIAAKGVVFTRAFAHNPITLPSHANILLGTTPLYHGVHENSKSRVSGDLLSLAKYLKSKGYSTGAFVGAFPLDSRFGLNQGFDVYDDSYPSKPSYEFIYAERKAEKVIQAALGWLKSQNSSWFSWVHLWDPHAPYLPPEPFKSKFHDDPYSGEVAYVDSELGKMFDYLESSKQMENTLIILTGDHGESLGEHGELTHNYFAYNSSIWVPLIIEGPEIKPARIDEYVCHIDLFPTLCDILGIEKPSFLQGVSLLPLIKGKKIKKRAIYFESLDAYYNRGWAPLRGFIEDGKKFITSPLPEFYNVESDFDEKTNLAPKMNLGEYEKKLKKMEKELSSFGKGQNLQKIDREAEEKLRSLGYVVSQVTQLKENYGPEDDLKTLLPFHDKMDKAILLDGEGKKAESIKLLNEIIQEKKDFTEAYTYLSYIYRSQERIGEALKIMEEGFNNNPKNYAILSGYGILLVREEKLDKAIEIIQKAIALYDLDPEVWNYLGFAYWRKGEYQKALEHYQKALSLDNTQAIIFSNLGALYLSIFLQTKRANDHTRSVEYFKKAIELDPDLSLAYKGLGVAYRLIEKVDDAISCWEKALELNPNDDFIVYNLGITYLERGNKSQALEYLKRYLSLKKYSLSPEEQKKIDALIQKCKQE